jgi:hypothetical protein
MAMAMAVARIALALRFAHDRERLRGVMKLGDSPIRLVMVEVELLLGGKEAPEVDVCAFVSLSLEIAFARPATLRPACPALVSRIIAAPP